MEPKKLSKYRIAHVVLALVQSVVIISILFWLPLTQNTIISLIAMAWVLLPLNIYLFNKISDLQNNIHVQYEKQVGVHFQFASLLVFIFVLAYGLISV